MAARWCDWCGGGRTDCDPLDIEYAARVDAFDFAMEVVIDDRGLRLEKRRV